MERENKKNFFIGTVAGWWGCYSTNGGGYGENDLYAGLNYSIDNFTIDFGYTVYTYSGAATSEYPNEHELKLIVSYDTSEYLGDFAICPYAAAYYILGGASSLKDGIHVRMDFLYERWSARTKAFVDLFTVFFMLFYLFVMIKGGYDSSMFALEFDQSNHTVWRPPMAPIKIIMTSGMALMFLQATAEFFKDLCRVAGRKV